MKGEPAPAFRGVLDHVRHRAGTVDAREGLLDGLLVGAVLVGVLALGNMSAEVIAGEPVWRPALTDLLGLVGLAGLCGTVGALVRRSRRRPDDAAVARRLDRAGALGSLTAGAEEALRRRTPDDPWARATLRRAAAGAGAVDPCAAWPMPPVGVRALLPVTLAAALVILAGAGRLGAGQEAVWSAAAGDDPSAAARLDLAAVDPPAVAGGPVPVRVLLSDAGGRTVPVAGRVAVEVEGAGVLTGDRVLALPTGSGDASAAALLDLAPGLPPALVRLAAERGGLRARALLDPCTAADRRRLGLSEAPARPDPSPWVRIPVVPPGPGPGDAGAGGAGNGDAGGGDAGDGRPGGAAADPDGPDDGRPPPAAGRDEPADARPSAGADEPVPMRGPGGDGAGPAPDPGLFGPRAERRDAEVRDEWLRPLFDEDGDWVERLVREHTARSRRGLLDGAGEGGGGEGGGGEGGAGEPVPEDWPRAAPALERRAEEALFRDRVPEHMAGSVRRYFDTLRGR